MHFFISSLRYRIKNKTLKKIIIIRKDKSKILLQRKLLKIVKDKMKEN